MSGHEREIGSETQGFFVQAGEPDQIVRKRDSGVFEHQHFGIYLTGGVLLRPTGEAFGSRVDELNFAGSVDDHDRIGGRRESGGKPEVIGTTVERPDGSCRAVQASSFIFRWIACIVQQIRGRD